MNPRIIAVLSAAAVVGLLGGTWIVTQSSKSDDRFAECRSSTVAGGAGALGGPFELVNAAGETVTDVDVITEPSILYFGYTFCPDVCPLDVARNVVAVEILEEEKNISTTPVFISIDPQRDTPEVVGDFAVNMHEKMIGLTGSPEQVKAASQAYRTYYRAQDGDEDYYLVDHSTFSYLVLPEHGFVEFFRREVSPEQMAQTVQCFVENA